MDGNLKGQRFVLMKAAPEGHDETPDTRWWADTRRPTGDPKQPYVAVQVYADRDPNDYRPVADMALLFTDQAEYYVVCRGCHSTHARQQWSGSTRGGPDWRERAEQYRATHERDKGWCEFCDPVFGNRGWRRGA